MERRFIWRGDDGFFMPGEEIVWRSGITYRASTGEMGWRAMESELDEPNFEPIAPTGPSRGVSGVGERGEDHCVCPFPRNSCPSCVHRIGCLACASATGVAHLYPDLAKRRIDHLWKCWAEQESRATAAEERAARLEGALRVIGDGCADAVNRMEAERPWPKPDDETVAVHECLAALRDAARAALSVSSDGAPK